MALEKPLSEAALAEVVEAMRLLNAAGRRIDAALGALEHCRVKFDKKPMRKVQDSLDAAYAALVNIPLDHYEAVQTQKGLSH